MASFRGDSWVYVSQQSDLLWSIEIGAWFKTWDKSMQMYEEQDADVYVYPWTGVTNKYSDFTECILT